MTEAMPFLQKYDITFLRPPTISPGDAVKIYFSSSVQSRVSRSLVHFSNWFSLVW